MPKKNKYEVWVKDPEPEIYEDYKSVREITEDIGLNSKRVTKIIENQNWVKDENMLPYEFMIKKVD